MKKLKLSQSAKEALTFLIVLLCVYVFLMGLLALISQTFDLGFAYVGVFVVSGMIAIGSTQSQSNS